MKVLFINSSRDEEVYGIELWMLRMVRELQALGHPSWLACRSDGGLWHAAQREQCPLKPYDPGKGLGLHASQVIRDLIRREGIDAVCVKTYHDLRLTAWACRGLPVKLFCRRGNIHDVKNNWRHFFHLALLKPEIIVPSHALKTEFSRISWINPRRIHVLHHGLNPERYRSSEVQSLAPGAVIFVGRLCFDKGIDVLLEAWAMVVRQIPTARLVLVGSGNQAAYQAQTQRLGITHAVLFAGYQVDVRPWLKKAAALVLPSRREGAGYVLIEAMAAGLPVAASRLECIAEYVKDGQTGLLVPPMDIALLADAILKIMRDGDMARNMGTAGLQRVRDQFSLAATGQKLESIMSVVDS